MLRFRDQPAASPMTHAARILASAARDPCAVIRELGGDPGAVMRAAGIDPAAVEGPEGAVPLAAYVALGQEAAARLRAPHFGHLAGWRFDIANLGEAGEAALRAPRLGAALRLLSAAFDAVQGQSELRLDVSADAARLSYRILDPAIWPRDQDAELTLGVLAGLLGRVAGPGWRPASLEFEHGPNGSEARACAARGPARWRAEANAIVFSPRLLDLPMPEADASAFQPLALRLGEAARRIEAATPLTLRVRVAIFRRLGRGATDQAAIGRALGLSERTLRRRLEAEGAAFHDLLWECREALARRLLAGGFSTAEAAERLGYSEASAFERAFRRRAGAGPAAFRRPV